jgi:hypothetical protein
MAVYFETEIVEYCFIYFYLQKLGLKHKKTKN